MKSTICRVARLGNFGATFSILLFGGQVGFAAINSILLPAASANRDGANGSDELRSVGRSQQCYGGSLFPQQPIVIRELRFRPSAAVGFAFSTTISNIQINLATSSSQPEALKLALADNLGPDRTTVFDGALAISSSFTGPAAGPKDFDVIVPFTKPFAFDPTKGNLVIDIINRSGSSASYLDNNGFAPGGDNCGRIWAYGVNPTTGIVPDPGADIVKIVYDAPAPPPPPPPPATDTNYVLLPAASANQDGANGSDELRSVGRSQQCYGSSLFPQQPIVIRELRFRPSAAVGFAFSTTISNIQINLATSSSQPEALKLALADNLGPDRTTVFDGALAISSSFTGPAAGPKDFDVIVPFTKPFAFDPTKGNLVIDIINRSGSSASYLDNNGFEPGGDNCGRIWAYGVNPTTGIVPDPGADIVKIVYDAPAPPPPPPTARITVSTLLIRPPETNLIVLAGDDHVASVTLDGSLSFDPEGAPLEFFWLDASHVPFATGVRTTNLFSVGAHEITLVVSDGTDVGTNQVAFEVVTSAGGIAAMIDLIKTSDLSRAVQRRLVSSLENAILELQQGRSKAVLNQLQAFQNKVRAQLRGTNPTAAQMLVDAAQQIIQSLM